MAERYDLIVIGSGPAGHHAAIQAAKLGKRVAIVERRYVAGGECVNTGTIPSKAIREAVLHLSGYRQKQFYGPQYAVKESITAQDLRQRVFQVVELETGIFHSQLRRSGIDVIRGRAFFLNEHRMAIENCAEADEIEADFFVIATGSMPAHPESIPFDDTSVFDSETFLEIPALPHSILVLGAGVVGVEYACMTAVLGISTCLVDEREHMLGFLDPEIVVSLQSHMNEMGISFQFGEDVAAIRKTESGRVTAELASGRLVQSDMLLYCVGRQGNTAGLCLEKAGLKTDAHGRIEVNERYQTRTPHIFAAGDVIGFPSLASVSMEQGRLAACHALRVPAPAMPHPIPFGIYTIPEISFIGMTETELKAKRIPYEIGIARYGEIARCNITGDTCGLLKLLFHSETEKLLGVHIIGDGAAELIHIGQAVMAFGGNLDYFLQNVFNYPTLAECYKVAAMAGRARSARKDGEAAIKSNPAGIAEKHSR